MGFSSMYHQGLDCGGSVGSLGTMGVLGGVRWVLVPIGFRRWSGLGGVGVLVTSAKTVLDGWVVPGWAVGVLEGWVGAVFIGLQESCSASYILVQCVGLQPW